MGAEASGTAAVSLVLQVRDTAAVKSLDGALMNKLNTNHKTNPNPDPNINPDPNPIP